MDQHPACKRAARRGTAPSPALPCPALTWKRSSAGHCQPGSVSSMACAPAPAASAASRSHLRSHTAACTHCRGRERAGLVDVCTAQARHAFGGTLDMQPRGKPDPAASSRWQRAGTRGCNPWSRVTFVMVWYAQRVCWAVVLRRVVDELEAAAWAAGRRRWCGRCCAGLLRLLRAAALLHVRMLIPIPCTHSHTCMQ